MVAALTITPESNAAATAQLGSDIAPEAAPLLLAAGGTWDNFARIRRGESADEAQQDEESASAAKTPPASAAAAPKPTATKPTGAKAKPAQKKVPAANKTPVAQKPKLAAAAKNAQGRPNPRLITAPPKPTETGSWWAFYLGLMDIDRNNWYDPHGIDFGWSYSHKNPMPAEPRIVVYMHGSGGGKGAMWVFGPSPKGDIEVRAQDAETHNADWREWWSVSADGVGYPGRRIAAVLNFVVERHAIDVSRRGLVLEGPSMGGAGSVVQAMILPDPWRGLIAYVSGRVGIIMPRRVAQKAPGQYASLPPDGPRNKGIWDSMDFSIQAAKDPIVQGIHYRHSFSTNDQFSEGPDGNTQVEFVNLVEKNKIGGAFSWVKAGHWMQEQGVKLPDLADFESPDQDITLDRAHPAFTRSTGNYPMRQTARVDEANFPRGHYNMGLIWKHADIIDDTSQLVFPLRYRHRSGIGKGIPDQARNITVSVTPRRPRHFVPVDGETLHWSWDGGAASGEARVRGGVVTIHSIPLASGEPYKNLRIYRK